LWGGCDPGSNPGKGIVFLGRISSNNFIKLNLGDLIMIPKASIAKIARRMAKRNQVGRVSDDGIILLKSQVEDMGREIASSAKRLAKHAGRNTVTSADIKLVIK
jgi:histone H3/H4